MAEKTPTTNPSLENGVDPDRLRVDPEHSKRLNEAAASGAAVGANDTADTQPVSDLAAWPVPIRHLLEEAIELLILACDEMQPDVDLEPDVDDEPDLARTEHGSCGGGDDRELDQADDEPSLGALEDHFGSRSQVNWGGNGYDRGDDREGDMADYEPDHDNEPDNRVMPFA